MAENLLAGNPSTEWDVVGAGSTTIQGFATQISVNVGETLSFKVNTTATAYRLDIYRMGYYGGAGARLVATVPGAQQPQVQPRPAVDATTGLLDYGTWVVSAEWPVPPTATSGIYFAKLVREDGVAGASHVVFVVRDDDDPADVLFQTSDTTWQAYNNYDDACLYDYLTTTGRAARVSYNRPFLTRDVEYGANWVFNSEYPMVRWLEANGFDVTYCAGADTDRQGDRLLQHRVFLSVGHDEYWSGRQRAQVEAARDAGVHLAFLSGNEVFWKVRWDDSIDGSATPYRTLTCYKEPTAGGRTDPMSEWTGLWRDSRFSPPADGGRPENTLTGTSFAVQGFSGNAITVPAEYGRHRFWRNTDIATAPAGTSTGLSAATLGYEWDEDADNGVRPAGLQRLSATTVNTLQLMLDLDLNFGAGTATHHLTLYRHDSGALVFGAGTVQWSWALDGTHLDGTHFPGSSMVDPRAQQAMINLFADMGVQPASVQAGLSAASASSDSTAPTSVITSPNEGDAVVPGLAMVVTGAASDVDGVVAAVEVSVDGGLSWRPAQGYESWSYVWTPSGNGSVELLSRAVDDTGNLESPTSGVVVTVGAPPPVLAPGGPVLVVLNPSYSTNPFGRYLGEMLCTEGLALFSEVELAVLMRDADPGAFLGAFPVVILAETRLLPAQHQLVRDYVAAGGHLIAMRPDPALADLFGLTYHGPRPEVALQFLALDTSTGPGLGLTEDSMQYHGAADTYALRGASALAALWDNATTASSSPAVTSYLSTATAGTAVAYTFDLAKSTVLTRQGNPQWADREGDAVQGVHTTNRNRPEQYRPMDMFVDLDGPIWFAPERLSIPQADEQQRFLVNIILELLGHPVPRVWYLPGTAHRMIVNTGDTCISTAADRTTMLNALARWNATVTLYVLHDQMSDADINATVEAQWRLDGHDSGVHVYAQPTAYGQAGLLRSSYEATAAAFESRYGHPVRSARNHTIKWVGWIDPANFESALGIELDLNYYHYLDLTAKTAARFPNITWPTTKDKAHGYFTGSGLPQRFCDENGAMIPVYQLLTEWADEFFADNGYTALQVYQLTEDMLRAADQGYYTAFVTNIHPVRFARADPITGAWAEALWKHAHDEDIFVWTAARFLDFTAARQRTRFDHISWDGTTLEFDLVGPAGTEGISVMLPAAGLVSTTVDGLPMTPTPDTISGRVVAFLTSLAEGAHVAATYS